MMYPHKIDLHMHSSVSDGSDSPEALLSNVKKAGIELFALTDHDDVAGCLAVMSMLQEGDPLFIPGVEFSCKDDEGRYHILGFGYDVNSSHILDVVKTVREYRMAKARFRYDFVTGELGFMMPEEEREYFLSLPNPGKPHLANLLIKYGYAEDRQQAIHEFIDKAVVHSRYVRPETAIEAILAAGGVPVLAHPIYGSGDQLIMGEEMDERLKRLVGFGLRGVEAFYSGFTAKMRDQMLSFADKYELYVTAGSDYHGTNKMIEIGDNGLDEVDVFPKGLTDFIERFV